VSGFDGSKLTAYLGERDRAGGRFLAERLIDAFAAGGLEAATLIRGVEGFGAKHLRRTDRLLTLSEDLPIVATGVGGPAAVTEVAASVAAFPGEAPVTIEPVWIADPTDSIDLDAGGFRGPWVKASVYLGRGRRIAGRPAYEAAVTRLRAAGVEGATVLLGVDGILGGDRQRAGFFSRNLDVPAIVVAVGAVEAIARGLSSLRALPGERVTTVEEAHVCKRPGGRLDAELDDGDDAQLRKLSLYSSEQAHVNGRPVHIAAVRRLRAAGATGATAMRGVWGFEGDHAPHGDRLRSLRRRVPTVTVVIDTRSRAARWLQVLDELTPARGLITSERIGAAVSRR
jgi:PII-like signaling protein